MVCRSKVVSSNLTINVTVIIAQATIQLEQHFTPLAQRKSTRAHNSGVTRSKLVGGILQFAVSELRRCHYSTMFNRYGVIRQHVELTSGSKM